MNSSTTLFVPWMLSAVELLCFQLKMVISRLLPKFASSLIIAKNSSYFVSLVVLCIVLLLTPSASAKGLSVISGKGFRGQVCTDCPVSTFDAGELTWALVLLGTVTAIFLAICFCRCYPKLKAVLCDDGTGHVHTRPRPRKCANNPGLRNIHQVHSKQQVQQDNSMVNGSGVHGQMANGHVLQYQVPLDAHGKVIVYPPGWKYHQQQSGYQSHSMSAGHHLVQRPEQQMSSGATNQPSAGQADRNLPHNQKKSSSSPPRHQGSSSNVQPNVQQASSAVQFSDATALCHM